MIKLAAKLTAELHWRMVEEGNKISILTMERKTHTKEGGKSTLGREEIENPSIVGRKLFHEGREAPHEGGLPKMAAGRFWLCLLLGF